MFGGWSADKVITVACAGNDPNTFRFCDQSQFHLPFQSDFKFAGSYPLPLGANRRHAGQLCRKSTLGELERSRQLVPRAAALNQCTANLVPPAANT